MKTHNHLILQQLSYEEGFFKARQKPFFDQQIFSISLTF